MSLSGYRVAVVEEEGLVVVSGRRRGGKIRLPLEWAKKHWQQFLESAIASNGNLHCRHPPLPRTR
jgi:hypothetical protein